MPSRLSIGIARIVRAISMAMSQKYLVVLRGDFEQTFLNDMVAFEVIDTHNNVNIMYRVKNVSETCGRSTRNCGGLAH